MRYRAGQKLCKIEWADGVPCLRVNTVERVTKSTYYMRGEKKASLGWTPQWRTAINAEYVWMFGAINERGKPKYRSWTIQDSVRGVCELRRLESKLARRKLTPTPESTP